MSNKKIEVKIQLGDLENIFTESELYQSFYEENKVLKEQIKNKPITLSLNSGDGFSL